MPDNTEDQHVTSLSASTFQQCYAGLTGCLTKNETLAHGIAHNSLRDFWWTLISYDDLNVRLHTTTDATFDLTSQWLGQQLYPTAGMGLLGLSTVIAYRYGLRREFPAADVFALIMGAGAAIYTWDRGQALGLTLFMQAGYSANTAGYLASIFCGLFEGPTQFLFFKLIKLLANDKEFTQFKHDPQNYLADLLAGFGVSITIGAIPGAVWQLVYNALLIGNAGSILTSVAVMVTVGVCNIATAKLIEKMQLSESYKACCETYCLNPPRTTDTNTHQSPLTQCIGFFKSCGDSKPNEASDSDYIAPLVTAPSVMS